MIQIIHGSIPSKSNQYRIGKKRLYNTDQVTNYKKNFALQYKRHETISLPFKFSAKVYFSNEKSDLDGCFKVVLDILQEIGAIQNDSLCTHIEAFKFIDKTNPRIELELKQISGFV